MFLYSKKLFSAVAAWGESISLVLLFLLGRRARDLKGNIFLFNYIKGSNGGGLGIMVARWQKSCGGVTEG